MMKILCVLYFFFQVFFGFGQKGKNELHSFYKYCYNLTIDCNDFISSSGFFLKINNTNSIENNNTNGDYYLPNCIYYINYDMYYPTSTKTYKDTIQVKLSDNQLDSIFILATNLFNLKERSIPFKEEKTTDKYSIPISNYEGMSATLDLELGLQREKYSLYIVNGSYERTHNLNYQYLIKYLLQIVKP